MTTNLLHGYETGVLALIFEIEFNVLELYYFATSLNRVMCAILIF